jgi:hypothetical protein
MTLHARASEIEVGDYVAYNVHGERRHVEAVKLLRDVGCVHVWAWDRVVSFPAEYKVEIVR